MQKKSLLVALFCGALCLTGCLKNEESASVAQVRIAKANELNSIADLNKAKAQAEVIYANAEATIANAEAKLREANAALVLAQAETEKVRAELLKVQVQLAEVTVEEEKVKLQLLEADLEKHLAEVEAAIAKAEAEKQGWINVLNHALADAERQSIVDAQAILEAEDKLEDYLLTQEGKNAHKAKKAAQKYFKALDSLQTLQRQQLMVKAEKALVEAGAVEVRDAIHYAIDQIDDEIAEREALVAYLKEYQTMTPEEAEEVLKEARAALNEAYNEYRAALEVREAAEKAEKALRQKKNEFFTGNWQGVMNAITSVPGIEIAPNYVDVKVGNGIVKAFAGGVNYETEDGIEYLPLFSDEAYAYDFTRYPDLDVYTVDPQGKYPILDGPYKNNKTNDFVTLQTTTIAPAAIYYDNIEIAMDTVLNRQQRFADANFAFVEWWNNMQAENLEKEIATLTEYNKLQQKYVDARKDSVEKYENAFIAEIGKQEAYEAEKTSTWKAFEEYMLLKTDVSRMYFVDRYMADTAYRKAYKDSATAAIKLATAMSGIAPLKTAVITTFETTFAEAEGAYNLSQARRTGSVYNTLVTELQKAEGRWNPDFGAAIKAGAKAGTTASTPLYKGVPQYAPETKWETTVPVTYAGSTQDSTQTWLANIDLAEKASYKAGINMVRFPEGTAEYEGYAKTKHVADSLVEALTAQLTAKISGVQAKEAAAEQLYNNRVEELDTYLYGEGNDKEKIFAAYNPAFNRDQIYDLCSFPTEARPDAKFKIYRDAVSYDPDKKNWYTGSDDNKKYAGTAQAALLDKVAAVEEAEFNTTKVAEAPAKQTLYGKWLFAAETLLAKESALETATKKLVVALDGGNPETADLTKVDLSKVDLKDYIDDEADALYQAFLDVENDSNYREALLALWKVYLGFNPDEVGKWETHPGFNQYNHSGIGDPDDDEIKPAEFGWLRSSYNVDYEATYVNLQGEREPIAWVLYPWEREQFTYSYAYQIEADQKEIDEEIPARIAGSKEWWDNYIKGVKEDIADALAAVNSYKAHEASYNALVADREEAEAAVNEALMDEFDAEQILIIVKAIHDAAEAVANNGMWVYDPDAKLYMKIYNETSKPAANVDDKWEDGFTWITINEEIARLEGTTDVLHEILGNLIVTALHEGDVPAFLKDGLDFKDLDALGISTESIAGLSFAKKLLQEALKVGKVGLQTVLEAFDAELAVLDEKIDFYTKIAAIYKGIMNGYLGIVDEADVEGETGPLDGEGEGDDEE